jgi:hypothetical protein
MKAVKLAVVLFLIYAGIVITFESLLGYFQPANESTLVMTITDEDGTSNDRVLARIQSGDKLYVSANHWPRAWYHQALENPKVLVTLDGAKRNYLAVPATEEEQDRVNQEHPHGIMFQVLTGFPPRVFIRLDPR